MNRLLPSGLRAFFPRQVNSSPGNTVSVSQDHNGVGDREEPRFAWPVRGGIWPQVGLGSGADQRGLRLANDVEDSKLAEKLTIMHQVGSS